MLKQAILRNYYDAKYKAYVKMLAWVEVEVLRQSNFLNYINGEWLESEGNSTQTRENPANRELASTTPLSTVSDTEAAIDAARESFDKGDWAYSPPEYRAKLLTKFANGLSDNLSELAFLETAENGKILRNSRGEIKNAIEHLEFFAGLARNLKGDLIDKGSSNLSFVFREPIGVCGLIVPWNSPVELTIRKLAPALAVGCSVVVKPSSLTPGTVLFLGHVLEKLEIPRGVVNIISGPGEKVGETIVKSKHVDKISFTGDSRTGKRILSIASADTKRTSMELGGKSPVLVFEDATLEKAVPSAMWAIFRNNGQSCTAGSRLLLQDTIYDKFLRELVRLTREIKIGDPLDPKSDTGPLASSAQLEKTLEYVSLGLSEGANLACGGSKITEGKLSNGYYFQPTILDSVQYTARVAREEIFGPVLSVIKFHDEEEAIKMANSTEYGLASSVWTNNLSKTFRVAKKIRAGDVWINGYSLRTAQAPMGGYKSSGIGRELGERGLDEFVEYKQVAVDSSNSYKRPEK